MLTIKKEITVRQTKYLGIATKHQLVAITLAALFALGMYSFISNFGEVVAYTVQNKGIVERLMIQHAEAEEHILAD